ncbi:unnamed protein product, partial [Mesorhabditis belari]|uniref:mRNA-decapping enzyme C-terminal domain-containing protein n=1 Tax=Mesorhabditis belari TaxID=2138241 RepID=A0AAF3FJ96_9BILA
MDPNVAKNLSSIRNIDPCAEAILDKTTHTALYRFNNISKQWEKTDVDGSMFVYERVDVPFYSLIIANRQSLNDMIEPITAQVRVTIQKPYLFFCKADGEIRGFWFYKNEDCDRIFLLLNQIISDLQAGKEKCTSLPKMVNATPSPAPPQTSALPTALPASENSSVMDILQKLNKPKTTPAPQKPRNDDQPGSSLSIAPQGVSIMQQIFDSGRLSGRETPPSNVSGMHVADLEKQLIKQNEKIAKIPSPTMGVSASAASLKAFSTLSVHGSEDHCASEIDSTSLQGIEIERDTDIPLLDKEQFRTSLLHLLQNDDSFVSVLHQTYVEALLNRLSINK